MSDLPKRIEVSRTVTYDVADVVKSLESLGKDNIDFDAVMEYIEEWVYEDMREPVDRHDLVFQDENGEEVW
jgi:hypothetical protein